MPASATLKAALPVCKLLASLRSRPLHRRAAPVTVKRITIIMIATIMAIPRESVKIFFIEGLPLVKILTAKVLPRQGSGKNCSKFEFSENH